MNTILIVEPNPDIMRNLEENMLKMYPNSKILVYADSLLAFQYVYNYKVDIILTAIHMKRLDGLEFAKMVKEISPHTQVNFTEANWDKPELGEFYPCTFLSQRIAVYPGKADEAVEWLQTEEERKQLEGELAYFRGDFEKAIHLSEKTILCKRTKLCAMNLRMHTSIAMNNFGELVQTKEELEAMKEQFRGEERSALLLELSVQTILAIYKAATKPLRDIRAGLLPESARKLISLQQGHYYFQVHNYERVIGIMETILRYNQDERYAPSDIDLYLLCGQAYYELGEFEKAREYAERAIALGMPDGFVMPYADYMTGYGYILEQCIEDKWPDMFDRVISLCEDIWSNQLKVHNILTNSSISTLLTRREYQVARLVGKGYTNQEIAKQMGWSMAQVKRHMERIFDKLLVSKRAEINQYIL